MASVQHVSAADDSPSPVHQAPRQAPSRSMNYAHHTLQGSRVETASTASLRASQTPVPASRVSRDYVPAHQAANSASTNISTQPMRALRKSSRGETMPVIAKVQSTTVLSGGPSPLLRDLNTHSQPLPHRNYPGTPGATRSAARMALSSGGANGRAPLAKSSTSSLSHTLGSASSLTTSPTRRSYTTAAAAAAAAAAANAALPSDDVLCRILGTCLPSVFEALAKFQYHQATSVLDTFADEIAHDTLSRDVRLEWKSWDAFAVMVRLAASCESAYHLMRYLQPDMIHTETLEQLYNKLVVLLNHLVDDIQPVLRRAQQRTSRLERTNAAAAASSTRSSNSTTTSGNGSVSGGGGVQSVTSDEALQAELERLTLDDLEYYHGLLNQAAQFFVLRVSMLGLYRGLATQRPPHKYTGMAKTLERLIKRYAQFDHALLTTLKQSAMEELRTVKAAFDSEICMAQYDFTKSMVALHRFKTSLRLWSDHIDSVSEYPLFDESDDADDVDENASDDYILSSSTYSYSNSIGSSTFHMQQHAAAAAAYADSQYLGASAGDVPAPPPTGSLPRPQRESSFRRKSFTSALASASDMAAFAAASEQAVAAAAAANTPTALESKNAFSRLISQRGSLLKRGLSVASLRSKIQAATSSSSSQLPTTPTNALEHAILGSTPSVVTGVVGISSTPSMLTPSGGNGLNSVGGGTGSGGSSGFSTTNSHTLAAEMMASAVAKQEREDGYALPVYQWSKRFYRSLVAKFTLYFHRWLEPFERRGDALSPFDLTRFIRSPVGISYLQLIDVLLAKGSHRVEDGTASVMLILETDKLANKGAKFYANGYLCPGSSHDHAKCDDVKAPPVKKMGYAAKAAAASRSSTASSRTAPSSVGGVSTGSVSSATSAETNNTSSSSQPSHSLFNLNVDTEIYDDDNGDFAPLWGLRGWPAVFCYPQHEPPLQHWPNIVSLIMDNRYVLELQGGKGSVVHTERRLKTSYYITSVDPAVFLVLVLEGKRRPSEKTTQDFMQTMTENLQHSGVYQRGGSAAAASTSKS